jgi:hypothetical protein
MLASGEGFSKVCRAAPARLSNPAGSRPFELAGLTPLDYFGAMERGEIPFAAKAKVLGERPRNAASQRPLLSDRSMFNQRSAREDTRLPFLGENFSDHGQRSAVVFVIATLADLFLRTMWKGHR